MRLPHSIENTVGLIKQCDKNNLQPCQEKGLFVKKNYFLKIYIARYNKIK